MPPEHGADEQLTRRLTRALAENYLIDEWVSVSPQLAHGIGRDARSSAPVAVDVLLEGTSAIERATFRRANERAASLSERLTHPHIQMVLGAGAIGDLPYVATAAIDTRRLDEMVESGQRIDANDCARILADLAQALAHAHGEGVSHGRVAARHVLVDRKSRRAFLADFGADGGSMASDIAQLGKLGANLVGGTTAPEWLEDVIDKAARGSSAGGYLTAHELADDLSQRAPAGKDAGSASSAPAPGAVALDPVYVLGRSVVLSHQVTGANASLNRALDAFRALNAPASIETLDSAAFEAGIERRFVMLAAAENSTHRTADSMTVGRIVDASVPEVLSGASRLSSPRLGLTLQDTIGGAAADGGIMVFELPAAHPAWNTLTTAFGARLLLLSVTRASNGRDTKVSDVVMSAAIDPRKVGGAGSTAMIGGGLGGAILGGIAGGLAGGTMMAILGAIALGVVGGGAGAFIARSGAAEKTSAARREISVAIDALIG